jgi:hypothetical protein
MNQRLAGWLLVLPLCVGCVQNQVAPETGDASVDAPRLQEGRLIINNDRADLDARVDIVSEVLFIRAIETPDREQAHLAKSVTTRLVQRGEITPPTVNGYLVQANDIDISGKIAAVAYNYAGDVFAGAVQVIDFTHPTQPRLLSEVLYQNADVTAVLLHGSVLYVGSGSLDPALATPALLEEFLLSDVGLESTGRWLDMPSWVVTDLSQHGHDVMASVGARDGGVALVDRNAEALRMAAFVGEEDVRGIDFPTDGELAAVCGTNPRMAMMGVPGFARLGVHEIDGYNYPDAKGTIEVHSGVCYLGAGDGGFQVRGPDGGLLAALRHEDFSNLRPELMVTNAVSLHGELAFVAAGALGVQVVKVAGARGWAQGGGYDPDGLQALGELEFEDGLSSNMVKTRNNVMVVAAGVGGVKLVTLSGQDE